jgi:cell division GTPase FtsZ
MSRLLMDDPGRTGAGYSVNWISVGQEAVNAASSLTTNYWKTANATGYVGIHESQEPGMDGLDWLPTGGAALTIDAKFQDMVNARRALTPYTDSLHSLLEGANLNVLLSFLGEAFPSGIIPGIAQASMDEGAVTVAVMSTPRQDEGRKHYLQSKYAKNEIRSMVDATCIIPLDLLCNYLAPYMVMSMIEKSVHTVFSRAMRGIIDLTLYPGFRSPCRDEIMAFFKLADNLLFGYAQLDNNVTSNIEAVRFALKNPLDPNRRFDEAEQVLVSVCLGTQAFDVEFYQNLGRICRDVIGSNVDVIIGCFQSQLQHEESWLAIYGRGLRDKRNDGFDFPDARQDPEKSAPPLPAYYRRHFGHVSGRFH